MPKRTILVNYHACNPKQCANGICMAALACERKVLTQEAPYEMPEANASLCLGCSLCLRVCPQGSIKML